MALSAEIETATVDAVANGSLGAYDASGIYAPYDAPYSYVVGWANLSSDLADDAAFLDSTGYRDIDVYTVGVVASGTSVSYRVAIAPQYGATEGTLGGSATVFAIARDASTGAYTVVGQATASGSVGFGGDGSSTYYLAVAAADDPSFAYAFPYLLMGWGYPNYSWFSETGAYGATYAGARNTMSGILNGALAEYGSLAGSTAATPAKDSGASALIAHDSYTGYFHDSDTTNGVRVLSMGAGDSIVRPELGIDVAVDGGDGLDTLMFPSRRHDAHIAADYTETGTNRDPVAHSGFEGMAFLESVYDNSRGASASEAYGPGHWFFEDVIRVDGMADAVYVSTTMSVGGRPSRGTGLDDTYSSVQHGGSFVAGAVQFADIDGDGYTDLILQGNDNRFWANFGGSSGLTSPAELVAEHGGTPDVDAVHYVDMTGDGKADLIMQGLDNRFWMSAGGTDGFGTPTLVAEHGGPYSPDQVSFGDFDGDGLSDLLFQGVDNRFWVALSDGTTFGDSFLVAEHGGEFNPDKVNFADVNGDGRVDLIYQGDDNRFWVGYSDGTDFGDAELAATHSADAFGKGKAYFADFDADGMTDLMYQGEHDAFTLYTANGTTGFDEGRAFLNLPFEATDGEVAFADISNDGRPDLIRITADNNVWLSITGTDTFF